jgi:hypothetical protein
MPPPDPTSPPLDMACPSADAASKISPFSRGASTGQRRFTETTELLRDGEGSLAQCGGKEDKLTKAATRRRKNGRSPARRTEE